MTAAQDSLPTVTTVAFWWRDDAGRFSAVKRPDDTISLPGIWGLPSLAAKPGESPEAAVVRGGQAKLGVDVEIVRYVGDDRGERPGYRLHLMEYEVRLVKGNPKVPQSDPSITQYSAFKMADDPKILLAAAEQDSLCSRIFLREQGLWK